MPEKSQNDTLELDKAIIVEEVKKVCNHLHSEDDSLGQLDNMFGSFQKQL